MDRYEKVEKLKENLQKEKVGSRQQGKPVATALQRTSQPVTRRDDSTVAITCVSARADFPFPHTWAAAELPNGRWRESAQELERKFRRQQKTLGAGEEKKASDSEDELSDADDEKVAETDQADFGKVSKRVRTAGGGASGTVRCVHHARRGMRTHGYGHAHLRKQGVT